MTQEEELQVLREENRLLKELVTELLPLREEVARLKEQVNELQQRLAQDSRASSQPPSADGLARQPRRGRRPSGKPSGVSQAMQDARSRWWSSLTKSNASDRRSAALARSPSERCQEVWWIVARCLTCLRCACGRGNINSKPCVVPNATRSPREGSPRRGSSGAVRSQRAGVGSLSASGAPAAAGPHLPSAH
jgi:hypothetical protein